MSQRWPCKGLAEVCWSETPQKSAQVCAGVSSVEYCRNTVGVLLGLVILNQGAHTEVFEQGGGVPVVVCCEGCSRRSYVIPLAPLKAGSCTSSCT